MENRRRIEAGVFPLHVVLIQHIQSFLDGKEAAQTSVLSKSWYSAWSTRPNLDFDQTHFLNQKRKGFWEFAKKTMQRYEALNLRIESFRLVGLYWPSSDFCLAKELIVKAMRMGAVDFNFRLIKHLYSCQGITLPHEVLGSETLIRLSLYGCKINIRPDGKVFCGKLKSLYLNSVLLTEEVIYGLISSCPLIEKLTLDSIKDHRACTFELGSRNLFELYKLKSLFLENVDVDTLFFNNLSANFPCLKDLTLEDCYGYNSQIQLSSRSLECISFKQRNKVLRVNFYVPILRVNFNVPSLRNFKFSGSSLPSLNFISTSREWESDISVAYDYSGGTAWFLELKKLLSRLSLSKISLKLSIWYLKDNCPKYQPLPETAVENVAIHVVLASIFFTVFEYLFWSCRPKFVTLHLDSKRGLSSTEKVDNDFLASLLERNVERVRKNCLMMNHELEEVDVEFFEESVAERRPLPKKIHFRLGWRGQSLKQS